MADDLGGVIKQLKDSAQETIEQKARAEALFASIGDGVIVTDQHGNISRANQAALDLLGFSKKDIMGKWFPKAIKDVDDQGIDIPLEERPILLALETGKPVSSKGNYVMKDGGVLPVFVTSSPFLVNKRPVGAVNTIRDRSEEMRIERTKDEFISLVSHQLRTPLTSIRLFAEMLADGQVGQLNPSQKDYIEKVSLSTQRMIKLVSDVLNVSRIELGRLKIQPSHTDLVELIQSQIEEVSVIANEKGIKIDFIPPKDELEKIPVDPLLMSQVVHNLLSNAIRYTPGENGCIKVSVKPNGNDYIIAVTDNGIGIPKKLQPRIFERFFRADNAMSVEGEGTGLGLYLIKIIMNASGGEVWFESKEKIGTTFYVKIPVSGMTAHMGEKSLSGQLVS